MKVTNVQNETNTPKTGKQVTILVASHVQTIYDQFHIRTLDGVVIVQQTYQIHWRNFTRHWCNPESSFLHLLCMIHKTTLDKCVEIHRTIFVTYSSYLCVYCWHRCYCTILRS